MNVNDLEMKLKMTGPYAARISVAMVGLGQAVELALNMKDRVVLREMRSVAEDIFEQAERVMDEAKNVQ
jgi:hypothetical protein